MKQFSDKAINTDMTEKQINPASFLAKRLFNYLFPLAALIGFIILAGYLFNGFCVALKVTYNGETIGYVDSCEVFNDAYDKMEQRMVGVEDLYPTVKAPVYSMSIVRNSGISTSDELCDKMLEINCDSLTEATGVFYGSSLIGVSDDKTAMESSIAQFLINRSGESDDEGTIEFCREITYQTGLFPSVSVVSASQFDKNINTPYYVTATYSTVRGDTFESVAADYNMEYSDFITLNYDIYSKSTRLSAGTVLLVKVPKYELETQFYTYDSYTQTLEYGIIQNADPSHYIGYSAISSEGRDGLEKITVKVITQEGVVKDTIITDRKTVVEPVDEVVTIGTKSTGNVSYLTKYLWPTKTTGFYISAYYGDGRNHKGIDIAVPTGTEIFAADDGIVTNSGFDAGGYGYYVIITHTDGYKTVYGHCSVLLVNTGDTVSRGDLIAYSGNTGNTTGPHLHFEVRYNGDRIDPAPFLGINEETGEIKALKDVSDLSDSASASGGNSSADNNASSGVSSGGDGILSSEVATDSKDD
ncbi:MAG: M23 family metallopeptidase [Acutalibacteraceae bacterium]